MPAASQPTEPTPITWRPLGRYEIGPRLAAGGMAELYVARASGVHGFQKYVAIKRILPRWGDDREFVEMFLDEARLAAQLDHPNVVHVHDIGEDDDGPFFTMDFIHGQSLLAIMRRQKQRGSFLSWEAFVALGSAAAAGLHHAHERRGFDGKPLGIIHRDVSPTNILVTYEGAVKIVDFGIAKAATSRHATRPSVRKGKMAYMSPEQCRGDTLDRRSDVFALGVVLYELATLTRAFHGEGEFSVMNQIVNHDLEPASRRRPDLPPELDRILGRALARDRDARYGSARELQRDLDALAVDEGRLATPEALAVMMEELFGATPYPWEGAIDASPTDAGGGVAARSSEADEDDERDEGTEATPTTARPASATSATRAKPMPATGSTSATHHAQVPTATPAAVPRADRRRTWILGGVGAAALASIAWMAVPRGEAASPRMQAEARDEAPPPTAADAAAASLPASGATPSPPLAAAPAVGAPVPMPAATPSDPIASTSTTATPPSPSPSSDPPAAPASDPKPERRTSKPARPRPTTSTAEPSPTLPAPFDPDAPAPRVR